MTKNLLLLAAFVLGTAQAANAQQGYLLNESFSLDEGGPLEATRTLPEGWTTVDQYTGDDIRYNWAVQYDERASIMTGSNYMAVDGSMFATTSDEDGAGPREEILLTPELDLNGTYQLTFQWKAAAKSSLADGEYELQVRVLDLATNQYTTIFNSSNADDCLNSGVQGDPNDASYIWPNWGKNTSKLDLSDFQGKKVKVAFVYVMKATKANTLYIDEVKVRQGEAETGPVASVDMTTYDFGQLYVGERNLSEAFTLRNTGKSGLTVTGLEAPEGIGLVTDLSDVNLYRNETVQFQLYYSATMTTPAEADVVLKTSGGDVTIHVKAQKSLVPDGYTLETFEAETFPPAGWQARHWSQNYGLEGNYSAYSPGYIEPGTLVSPRLDLSDATRPHTLKFTYFAQFDSQEGGTYYNNDLSVWVSADGGQTWSKNDSIWTADYENDVNKIVNVDVDLAKYTSDNVRVMWKNSAVAYDSESGMLETASFYLDRVLLPCLYGVDGKPLETELTTPADKAENVYHKNVVLSWKEAQFAQGYKLYVGKSATTFDLMDGQDVGNVTTYTLSELDNATTYYWKVVAYNEQGDAETAATRSFTTQADMSVTEFPWFEGFEGSTFPTLGWYVEGRGWSNNTIEPFDGKVSASASARNVDTKPTLYSPDVKLPADKDLQLTFWWGNAMSVNLTKDENEIHTNTTTESDGIDAGFFEIYADGEWKQLSILSDPAEENLYWLRERFDLSPYKGKTVQFRWRYEMYDYNKCKGISLDNVELRDANETNVALSTTGWFAAKVNADRQVTSPTLTLSNFGGNDLTVAEAKLTTDNFTTTLRAGDVVAAGQTLNFTLTFEAKQAAGEQDSVTVNDVLTLTLSDGARLTLPVSGIALADDIAYFDFETDATGEAPKNFSVIDEDDSFTMEPMFWEWPNLGGKFAFFVVNESQCLNEIKAPTGRQSLMSLVSASDYSAKDWIISPQLEARENSTFSFDARNGESVNAMMPGKLASLTVWVSETGTDKADFVQIGQKHELPLYDEVAWNHYTYDLSAYAGKKIYVALKSEVEPEGLWTWYDNFEYAHVGFDKDITSGIGGLTTDSSIDTDAVEVYSPSGIRLAAGRGALDRLPQGIYIVKTGRKTVKMIKR